MFLFLFFFHIFMPLGSIENVTFGWQCVCKASLEIYPWSLGLAREE